MHTPFIFQHEPVAREFRHLRSSGRGGYGYRYTDSDLRELAARCRDCRLTYVLLNSRSMWEDAGRFQRLWQGLQKPR